MKHHYAGPVSPAGNWSVWFMSVDNEVGFEDASSRWFLAGRAVESYECS